MAYSENNEAQPDLSINVVPLIGVIAVLMVVVLVGFTPPATTKFQNVLSYGCGLCFGGSCHERDRLDLVVTETGKIRIEDREIAISELSKVIRLNPSAPGFKNLRITLDASGSSDYGAVIQTVSALKELGLADDHLRIYSTQ